MQCVVLDRLVPSVSLHFPDKLGHHCNGSNNMTMLIWRDGGNNIVHNLYGIERFGVAYEGIFLFKLNREGEMVRGSSEKGLAPLARRQNSSGTIFI